MFHEKKRHAALSHRCDLILLPRGKNINKNRLRKHAFVTAIKTGESLAVLILRSYHKISNQKNGAIYTPKNI